MRKPRSIVARFMAGESIDDLAGERCWHRHAVFYAEACQECKGAINNAIRRGLRPKKGKAKR